MSKEKKNKGSALNIQKGINQPDAFNKDVAGRIKKARGRRYTAQDYIKGVLERNRISLSKSITLIESSRPEDQAVAREVINGCLPHSGKSIRIGITGVPGVGKSTFIESFGKMLTTNGHKLAVLAIDPSSQRSRGSILGDKTRMEALSTDPQAFIRPSSSAGTLGGVARNTRESIMLCEAAGFDVIIVETVGVGQSETTVHGMVDFFLLLMLAGAGDELQGIKRGIMEMADAIVINKADGANLDRAKLAKAEFDNALHFYPPKESGWSPPVELASATEKTGLEEIWDIIVDYRREMVRAGYFERKRKEQLLKILEESIASSLMTEFYKSEPVKQNMEAFKRKILLGEASPYQLAHDLVMKYLQRETDR
jgi:LAO/AO transport system kinase